MEFNNFFDDWTFSIRHMRVVHVAEEHTGPNLILLKCVCGLKVGIGCVPPFCGRLLVHCFGCMSNAIGISGLVVF